MRKLLLAGWLVAPIGAWAFHEGPGQDLMALDRTDKVLAAARAHASAGEWDACVTSYGEALEKLPAGWAAQSRRIRLELDKARMLAKQLPEAHADLRAWSTSSPPTPRPRATPSRRRSWPRRGAPSRTRSTT
jgi:hypothetical protein